MKTPLYNSAGKEIGNVELDDAVFGVAADTRLVQRAVLAQVANARKAVAHTKTRSEVRGGGKKPWRQKGTGRARHGSIRSPIWIGGGVTFGPRNVRNFSVKMNAKERRKALKMGLSAKANTKKLIVVDALALDTPKTKQLAGLFRNFPFGNKRVLFVQPQPDANLTKAARNLPRVATIGANSLNVRDVVSAEYLMLPKSALEKISSLYR